MTLNIVVAPAKSQLFLKGFGEQKNTNSYKYTTKLITVILGLIIIIDNSRNHKLGGKDYDICTRKTSRPKHYKKSFFICPEWESTQRPLRITLNGRTTTPGITAIKPEYNRIK